MLEKVVRCIETDTYAITFALHPNLLQGDHVFCVHMHSFKHLAICAGSNDGLIAWLPVVH